MLGLIARTFVSRDKKIMLALYKSLVRPHLDYCIQAWRPYLKKDIDKIEKVQRRASKLIEGLKDLTYEERMRELKLTSLETRRIRADMIEVYKIINGLEGLKSEDFFDFVDLRKGSSTRGHKYKMYKKRFRSNFGKFSFGNRVVNEWNILTDFVVSAGNINEFKRRLDYHLGHSRGLK
jgi:ribonuclease P/MRP protein subunit RPP40